jgi:hypothetical protein
MFRALVGMENKHQFRLLNMVRKVLRCRCIKCPCIVLLNLICMNYDQRRGMSQIRNLILDHKSLESRGQMRFD